MSSELRTHYTDLSDVLKDNLDPLTMRRLRAEHQVEMFYNFHITPWLRLTADLQILRPTRPGGHQRSFRARAWK